MRLNLSFKDANITQVSQSEFKIVFDLSNMNKPRLSQDARLYIEHFNLPEFMDEAWGDRGQLKGYFELRCDNLSNNDYDSEYGHTSSCIIYTSPLTSYKSFSNDNPMFLSNFKINQSFLQDRLVFTLKVYDNQGDPFDTATLVTEDVDKDAQEYEDYQNAITRLHAANNAKDSVKKVEDELQADLILLQSFATEARNKYIAQRTILFQAFDSYIARPLQTGSNGSTRRGKVLSKMYKQIIQTEVINEIKYLFEVSNLNFSEAPLSVVSITTPFNKYYELWNQYIEAQAEYNQQSSIISQVQSSNNPIFKKFDIKFDPVDTYNVNTVLVSGQKTLPYKVDGTTKEGTVNISYHNSTKTTTSSFVLSNITPVDTTDPTGATVPAQAITQNDILTIDSSELEVLWVDNFSYYISKESTGVPNGISFPANSSGDTDDKRFALLVKRTPTQYEVLLHSSILSQGFATGDTIQINGHFLGGKTGTNDLIVEVADLIEPEQTVNYPLNDIESDKHPNKGTFDIEIQRTNTKGLSTDQPYIEISSDYTNTKGYSKNDVIEISGKELGGEEGTHNAKITVNSIVESSYRYDIDEKNSVHSIVSTRIDKTKVVRVTNSVGAEYTANFPTDFVINVTSENGEYKVVKANGDASKNFTDGDIIEIDGSNLTGKSTTNDLKIVVISTLNGAIVDLDVETASGNTYQARQPLVAVAGSAGFLAIVNTKHSVTEYELATLTGVDFEAGDIITVDGSELGGVTSDNDLEITISEVSAADKSATKQILTGNVEYPAGEVGRILTATLSGNGKFYPFLGQIDPTTIKIEISSQSPAIAPQVLDTPDIEIEIAENPIDESLSQLDAKINLERGNVVTTKNALVTTLSTKVTSLSKYQEKKLRNMNMSLVLYDEIPEYTQASQDAIKGNTYSRIQNCQFKRI